MNLQGFKPSPDKAYSLASCHENIVPREHLTDEQNYRYYEEYKKLLYTALCLDKQIAGFRDTKKNLDLKIVNIHKNLGSTGHVDNPPQSANSSDALKPKRIRRTNEQIERRFVCQQEKCDKAYASEGSLQQHMRLKHGKKREDRSESARDQIQK